MCSTKVHPRGVARFVCLLSMALAFALASALWPPSAARAQEAGKTAQRAEVEGSGGEWYVEGAGRAGDARVAEFLGRPS
ncbi:MAG TPA: hypothetical protein VGV38_04585, partial [Pyrinomonadaceae bacterium]|nr:hypothetical protein [Pyrinomonadaceae bacterium]